ncbi:unnamed protein product [Didymodactylos carnosus]|uniref:Uncharacterized protein n=1 Tax=Didymodactylos carnosus TaxID=1234261 RepID=A0A815YYV3_9BILA|nr:unnamed protein product [Didymodactylos carnosus]CAF4442014.1 unnamed protein product [Didymodactylos carnosus]
MLVNRMLYVRMQQELWQAYHDMGMAEGKFVEQRRKTIEAQQVKVVNQLNEHLMQRFTCWPLLDNNTIAVDISALSEAIIDLVMKDQKRLRAEFERKQVLLNLDANDRRLVESFCTVPVNKGQVRIDEK